MLCCAALRSPPAQVLILNGAVDRELTRGPLGPMTASDIVQASGAGLQGRRAGQGGWAGH